jgi:hypothetical protein
LPAAIGAASSQFCHRSFVGVGRRPFCQARDSFMSYALTS